MNADVEQAKLDAAQAAVEQIPTDVVIGLGSGSTAEYAIRALGLRVQDGLRIRAIASSNRTAQVAIESGIELSEFNGFRGLDFVIDGADKVDNNFTMIKGRGGVLVREKLMAVTAETVITVVDWTKLVDKFRDVVVPLEIMPFGVQHTLRRLQDLGTEPSLRQDKGTEFVSDNGNFIVDCRMEFLDDPKHWNTTLIQMPGVVETGIFLEGV